MFVVSKLLSAITQPMFWLAILMLVALILLEKRRKVSSGMLWTGMVIWGLLGFTAIPEALLRQLESKYEAPVTSNIGNHVGVIVLGGATGSPEVYKAHGQVPLGEAAERMTVPVGLMRVYPKLELVFSGGEGRLLPSGSTEAEIARVFYTEQGLDMKRVTLESQARSTRENVKRVAALLGERCKQPWLLVTSAWHMPRSMSEFQAVACNVTAYPVDFRTGGETTWTEYSMAGSLIAWQTALHEYLGMFVYWVTR